MTLNATTINGRQLYNISVSRGRLLWKLQTWHFNLEDALEYGRKMAELGHSSDPAVVIRVTAELAT